MHKNSGNPAIPLPSGSSVLLPLLVERLVSHASVVFDARCCLLPVLSMAKCRSRASLCLVGGGGHPESCGSMGIQWTTNSCWLFMRVRGFHIFRHIYNLTIYFDPGRSHIYIYIYIYGKILPVAHKGWLTPAHQ